MIIKQIAGILARRIVCRVKAGEFGPWGTLRLIRFGSRVDLLIPPEYAVYARPGQRVRGGESVLASSLSQSTQPPLLLRHNQIKRSPVAGLSGGTRAVSSA